MCLLLIALHFKLYGLGTVVTNRSGIECSSAPLLSASSVTLTLSFNDQYLLNTDPGIATNVSNTFLVIAQHHQIFNDAGSLLTIPPAFPLQALMVIPDTTGPRLVSFTLELDFGLLTLQFSEPVTDLNGVPPSSQLSMVLVYPTLLLVVDCNHIYQQQHLQSSSVLKI